MKSANSPDRNRFYQPKEPVDLKSQFYFFFDMDGTLCNSEGIYAQAFQKTMLEVLEVNITHEQAINYTLGRAVTDIIRKTLSDFEISKESEFAKRLEENFAKLKYNMTDDFLIEPTVNLFKYLVAEEYKICIVSGSSRADVEFVLKRMNIQSEIPIIGNGDYEHGKPNPGPYLQAAKIFNVPQSMFQQIIVIEDSPAGVESGHAAGMHVIGLQDSSQKEPLSNYGAAIVLNKSDIGAELKSRQNIDLTEWMKSYLQTLLNKQLEQISESVMEPSAFLVL
jgi:beta-phosphoglucomutase-like phosphatase (HAD superfamily)